MQKVFFKETLQGKYVIWKAEKIIILSDSMMNCRGKIKYSIYLNSHEQRKKTL